MAGNLAGAAGAAAEELASKRKQPGGNRPPRRRVPARPDRGAHRPAPPGSTQFLLAVVWFLAYGGMIYGQGSYLSPFLVGTDHFTAHQLFAEGLIAGLVGAAVFLIFSNVGERVGREAIIVTGCVAYPIGGCLLPFTHGVTGPCRPPATEP
jgi:hypothetical protein